MLVGLVVVAAACGSGDPAVPAVSPAETPVAVIELPEPRLSGQMSLEEALAARRSQRSFRDEGLSDTDLGQLLWATQGITQESGAGRAAPSAGGTYPLELYVASPAGVFHYRPDGHRLMQLSTEDQRALLAAAAGGQQHVEEAAVVIVIGAVFERTTGRYGDRGERYAILEAGHAAQNLLLQAVALELAAVPVGAFGDDDIRGLLGLPPGVVPLYLVPVGHPPDG